MLKYRPRWNVALAVCKLAIVIAVMALGRCVVASDQAADHSASTYPGHSEPAHSELAHAEPETRDDKTKSGTHGIDLGEFRVRVYHVAESQKSSATFSLYATAEEDRLAELKQLLEHRKHKLRDQIIVVTRLLPLGDFDDPDLKTFRRRILLQLRRALPELVIENVYISDFELQVERI